MNNPDSALEAQVRAGKPVWTVTRGDSMRPLLDTNRTQVLIVRAEGPLEKNQLPLYRRPSGQFVLHRIIRADAGAYYTRGDNRTGLERVPREWVLGVVTEITRKGRSFPVTDWRYRWYVAVWNGIYPLRWAVYKLRGRLRRT